MYSPWAADFFFFFQRMNIGLRAFFVIADSLVRKVRVLIASGTCMSCELKSLYNAYKS